MAYIDETYYNDVYKGIKPEDPSELTQAIARASDMVDEFTNYQIKDINSLFPWQIENIEKATAKIAEGYLLQGGYESASSPGLGNVKLGSFGYSDPGGGNSNVAPQNSNAISSVPSAAISLLGATGLMYTGVRTK